MKLCSEMPLIAVFLVGFLSQTHVRAEVPLSFAVSEATIVARGKEILANVTTVQRINTKGGTLEGSCENLGGYRSVPYSADYVFLRQSN